MSHCRDIGHVARSSAARAFFIILTLITLIVRPSAQTSSCDDVIGQWTITNITPFRMTINRDGTGGFHTGITFRWSCHGNSFVYTDSMGIRTQMTLSHDHMHMVGAGTMGETITAVRNSPLVTVKRALSSSASDEPNPKSTQGRQQTTVSVAKKKSSPPNGSNATGQQQACAAKCQAETQSFVQDAPEFDDEVTPAEAKQITRACMVVCLKGQ